jgi:hypothetical protein
MAEPDKPDAALIATLGGTGAVLLLVLIIALQVLYYHAAQEETLRKVISVPPYEYNTLVARQLEQLQGPQAYRWVDQAKGKVGLPIDRAMELVVRERAAGLATQALRPAPGRE